MTSAQILADSIHAGHRLTTFDLTLPMYIQPQLLRHRAFSFSVQSTRAIPLKTQIQRVLTNPVTPYRWGAAEKGMVAHHDLSPRDQKKAIDEWGFARGQACAAAEALLELGVHQEVAGRLLMPFAWCRMILSGTEFDNFFALRIDEHAQGEIRHLAEAMKQAMSMSVPVERILGEWHLPMVTHEEMVHYQEGAAFISAGRCARVSYLQHDGKRDPERDQQLGRRLARDGHWSAMEHQACPTKNPSMPSNFQGWTQFRKIFNHEDNRAAWLRWEASK